MKMKTAPVALLLLASVSSAALAQEDGRRGLGERGPRSSVPAARPQQEQRATPPEQRAPQPEQRQDRGDRNGGRGDQNRGDQPARGDQIRGDQNRGRDDNRGERGGRNDNGWRGDDRRGDNRWQNDNRRDDRGRADNRGWNDDNRWRGNDGRNDRRDGPRWDRRQYPPIYSSPTRYRGSAYIAPRGYYARSWSYGQILPRGWYGQEYRIYDFSRYGLPYPPPGYDWVRVGPDVLLVDTFTGEIVQVVRTVFW